MKIGNMFEKFINIKKPSNVELQGGMSQDQVSLEQHMDQWTPRQKAAAAFLVSLSPQWKTMLAKMPLGQRIEYIEKFAEKPKRIIQSASWDEKNQRFVAEGSISTGSFSG